MKNVNSYIDLCANTSLLDIERLDIRDFLLSISDYNLSLRKSLNLPEELTFGIEIEFENCNRKNVDERLEIAFTDGKYKTKKDGSLDTGGEIATPILKDDWSYYEDIKRVCEIINLEKGIATENTGGHVHIGTNIIGLSGEKWYQFLLTWVAYENILIRFFNGEYLYSREGLTRYAKPMGNRLLDRLIKDKKEFTKELDPNFIKKLNKLEKDKHDVMRRYQAINFENIKDNPEIIEGNTIELRCPSGTTDPVIWQNYVMVISNLLKKAGNINMDIVNNRLAKTIGTLDNIELY